MPIADDWDFNYSAKVLSHIDGVLSYDGGTAGQAAVGDYVYGGTSGAVGKVLARTGTAASGTYTLTNVVGLFEDNEAIELCSVVGFDTVVSKASFDLQGIRIGDTVTDQTTGSIDVLAIEYNTSELAGGEGGGTGRLYGNNFTAFTDNDSLDITGGESGVASVHTAEGNADNDTVIDTALVNGTLAVPGTANTNDALIIHYDAGSQLVPEQAIVEGVTSGAVGLVEQQYGPADGSVGSLRLVDSTHGAGNFQNNETLRVQQVVNYDAQVGGQVFSVGDIVVGATSGATGRVLAVIDDGDSTGRLILADESGTWDAVTPDDIEVDGVKIAEVENTTFTLNVSTLNLPDGVRTWQRPNSIGGNMDQGGIYDEGDSLNIVRKANSLYTLSQDTFDELLQLDDDEAIDATGKNLAYQVVFDWLIPDLSFRFLRAGAWTDTNSQNIWANPQTVGAQNKITDTAFLVDSTQPFWQPQLYIEQQDLKVETTWIEGNIDVLLKVKSLNDTRLIDPATPALGQVYAGGDPNVSGGYAVFNREFHTSTYDTTQDAAPSGGVRTVALGTGDDTAADRNPQGTHTFAWDGGSAASLVVGEMFYTTPVGGNGRKIGQVVAQTGGAGATGTVEYVLKSGTQFADNEALTAEVSGKTFTVDETGGFDSTNDVVAGFAADIRFNVVEIAATPSGGTGITGTFIPGEGVTQAVTGATGWVVFADTVADVLYIEKNNATAFSGDNDITGDTSSASWDAGTGATYPSATTFNADLNNGEGAAPYAGSVSGDITGASAETMQNVYQYSKYLAAAEQASISIAGPGTSGVDDDSTLGRFYRRLKNAYAEVKPGNPFGVYTGSMAFAQGWFLDTDYIDANDIRAFSVIDDNGVARNPPNLQSLVINNVAAGWRVAAYRSTGTGLLPILRTEFDVGTVGAGNNQAGDSTVLVGANTRSVGPLPADVPDTGVLRVLSPNGTGNYIRMTYSSVNRTTNIFTLTGTIGSFLTAAGETSTDLVLDDNVHVAFIEEQAAGASVSNTIQYVADIPIVYKARLKGFKPFRSTGTFGSAGAILGVVQTADPIVDLP